VYLQLGFGGLGLVTLCFCKVSGFKFLLGSFITLGVNLALFLYDFNLANLSEIPGLFVSFKTPTPQALA
jgi:hypothetical protein